MRSHYIALLYALQYNDITTSVLELLIQMVARTLLSWSMEMAVLGLLVHIRSCIQGSSPWSMAIVCCTIDTIWRYLTPLFVAQMVYTNLLKKSLWWGTYCAFLIAIFTFSLFVCESSIRICCTQPLNYLFLQALTLETLLEHHAQKEGPVDTQKERKPSLVRWWRLVAIAVLAHTLPDT